MGQLFRRRRLGPREDERGVVAVFSAFVLVVIMGVLAVVVDLGMERVTRADLQALADVVALDLAREIRSRRTQADLAVEGDFSDASSAVRESAARNVDVLGDDLDIEVDWGSYDDEVWNTATDPPSAVEVTVSADADYAVAEGAGAVTRTAYAVASSSACYRLGTFVAAIRTGDSTVLGPLNHLLGVNLDLVSYGALADADVTLADLAASPVIGSPQQLLSGTGPYADVLRAMIDVLSNEPNANNSAAISALKTILNASETAGSLILTDVLHVAPDDRAALDIALNVLDIVGSARLATGEHFLEVDNIQAGVPGVGFQFTGGLSLVSAAQLACGEPNSTESIARSAQLQGSLGIDFVNLPSLNVPNVGTLQTAKGRGTLQVSVADGEGQLVAPPEVYCGDGRAGDPHRFSVAVRTQPASYSLASELEIYGDVKVSNLQKLGLGGLLTEMFGDPPPNKVTIDVDVRLDVASNHPGGASTASLSIPPNDVTPVSTGDTVHLDPRYVVPTVTRVEVNGSSVALSRVVALTDLIANQLVTETNGFVGKTLVPLIDNVNNVLVGPVARMVGLRFGGADVYAVGAVCADPDLWG